MIDDNDIPWRIRNIKYLNALDRRMLRLSGLALKQGDYLAAQKFRATIAVNEAEIERLKEVGPNIRIIP